MSAGSGLKRGGLATNARKRADLGEARPIDGNLLVGEKRDVEAGRRINPDSSGVEAMRLDAGVGGGHGLPSSVVVVQQQHEDGCLHLRKASVRVNEIDLQV